LQVEGHTHNTSLAVNVTAEKNMLTLNQISSRVLPHHMVVNMKRMQEKNTNQVAMTTKYPDLQ